MGKIVGWKAGKARKARKTEREQGRRGNMWGED